jgi:hypothetical protein
LGKKSNINNLSSIKIDNKSLNVSVNKSNMYIPKNMDSSIISNRIIKLILFDNITKKGFYIYPTELCYIDYFNKLFNRFKEKDDVIVQIIVPDTNTTCDIILTEIIPNQKFGYKENIDYLKKWFICQNFLSMQLPKFFASKKIWGQTYHY